MALIGWLRVNKTEFWFEDVEVWKGIYLNYNSMRLKNLSLNMFGPVVFIL